MAKLLSSLADTTAGVGDTFGNKKVIALVGGKPVYGETIRDELRDAIAKLELADQKRLITVTRDHQPSDSETDGSWGLWRSQIPNPPNVKINFYLWIGGQYSYALMDEDIEIPWEALAVYDPARQTYSIPIEGLSIEYNKTPIANLGNKYFNPPALIFTFKDADKVFSTISWRCYNANNIEIGNGSGATQPGELLTVIQVNPAMAGAESTVITKVIFEFTKLDGTKIPYEVKI